MAYCSRAFTLLTYIQFAQGAPTRNLTALRTEYAPAFVSDPDGRGTWSLLYSSIFTLGLCVWTAIHPNVPSSGASSVAKYHLKALWVVLAVFAPEIGVLTAFKQYKKAKALSSRLSQLRAQQASDGSHTCDGAEPVTDGEISTITDGSKPVSLQTHLIIIETTRF